MKLFSVLKFICNHELNKKNKLKALVRFFKWQLNCKLNPYPVIFPFTARAKLIIGKGMTGATGNLYCGLHDFEDMSFLLHFLRREDLFIDIGANIGSYTVLAAAHIGATTLSFEPVPSTFSHLLNNIALNRIGNKVQAFNIALSAEKGSVSFTSSLDTVNHVALNAEQDQIEVNTERLDDVLTEQMSPLLIKIDVEGFEAEVLKGATNTLKNSNLRAIIIELNGSGARYGYEDQHIHQSLIDLGFDAYVYKPFERILTGVRKLGTLNTIYIRDFDFVEGRLKSAEEINILNNRY